MRAVVALCLLLAGCGDAGSAGSAPADAPFDPFAEVTPQRIDHDDRERAAPRWEQVATAAGGRSETVAFTVADGAIQWRANWTCAEGSLRLAVDAEPLADVSCPDEGEAYAISTGGIELAVDATGPWEVAVEQQVDTGLAEPPLPEMAAAEVLGRGDFHGIEENGEGAAVLYRLADGRLALRLENFSTTDSADLFVWLSTVPHPRTSEEIFSAPYTAIGPLRSTLGDQNYLLPSDLDPSTVASVVIWCEPIRIAYAAAPLQE